MEQLLETLRVYLNSSSPDDFKVRSITDMSGNTTTFNSYSELLDAYNRVYSQVQIENAMAFSPVRIGAGRFNRGSY